MRTRLEIQTKLTPLLFATTTSTYFTPTRIITAISDAYLWAGNAKPWPDIKKGFVTSTVSGQDYYDYPCNCQSESLFKVMVDGVATYEKKDFEDYLKWKEDNPNSTDKYWSEYARQFFITPTPSTNGASNLIVWGVIQVVSLTADGDETIFTDWSDVTNEAILQKAYSDLMENVDSAKSANALVKAQGIIDQSYLKIARRLQRKQRMDKPQFIVPDFYQNSISDSKTGNFSIRED
jgi:hypothetical protein